MRIKGKFAPLTDELGYDPRFKELNDLEKLMYVLIIHTCHMTRHQAPTDPNYYRMQYGVQHRSYQIRQAIDKLLTTYRQLRANDSPTDCQRSANDSPTDCQRSANDSPTDCQRSAKSKTLSLINSATYKSQIRLEEETEVEIEIERRKENKTSAFTAPLKALPSHDVSEVEKFADEKFDIFWGAYKRKEGKEDAIKAWTQAFKDKSKKWISVEEAEDLFPKIMEGLSKQEQKHTQLLSEGAPQFIPLPATWVRGKRWQDEVSNVQSNKQERKPVYVDARTRS
jgi:hypothetical protein